MRRWVVVAVAAALCGSCAKRLERTLVEPHDARRLDRDSTFLKAHMRDGHLYVLSNWKVDEARGEVRGVGDHFDARREHLASGTHTVVIADVALFETNVPVTSRSMISISVLTVLSAAVTAGCALSPKACFGSCPTFYADGDATLHAEAFSDAVAPSLARRDVDALVRVRPRGRELELRMTNEALETHVVTRADLLVAPRPPGGRVFATADGALWAADDLRAPRACEGVAGDCAATVAAFDDDWLASETDARDLAAREHVVLAFDAAPGGEPRAIAISARQSFVTTFLFYQALAYMGRNAGAYLAALERGGDELRRMNAAVELLGGIEVQVRDARGAWVTAGSFHETGPLATDTQLVLLPDGADASQVRLRMAQGYWRVDRVVSVRALGPVDGERVQPGVARDADAERRLRDPELAVTTLPGDELRLRYELPDGDLELFLDAEGYYLEWMREEWLAEESAARLALLLYQPALALRLLAPEFKEVEPVIEQAFWSSRYAR